MADELQTKRIIELAQKTAPEEGDNLAVDNATSGTRRITWENLLDGNLADDNKAAPAGATRRAIEDAKTTFTDLGDGNIAVDYDENEPAGTEVPLQSLRFPLLPYKYTVPIVDPTLTQSGQAADAKVTGENINNIFSDLTELSKEIDGNIPLRYSVTTGEANVDTPLVEHFALEKSTQYKFTFRIKEAINTATYFHIYKDQSTHLVTKTIPIGYTSVEYTLNVSASVPFTDGKIIVQVNKADVYCEVEIKPTSAIQSRVDKLETQLNTDITRVEGKADMALADIDDLSDTVDGNKSLIDTLADEIGVFIPVRYTGESGEANVGTVIVPHLALDRGTQYKFTFSIKEAINTVVYFTVYKDQSTALITKTINIGGTSVTYNLTTSTSTPFTDGKISITVNKANVSCGILLEKTGDPPSIIDDLLEAPLTTLPAYVRGCLAYRPLGALSKPYLHLASDDGNISLNTYTIPMLLEKEVPCTFALFRDSAVLQDETNIAIVKNALENGGCSVAQHGGHYWTQSNERQLNEFFAAEAEFFEELEIDVEGAVFPGGYTNDMITSLVGGFYGVMRTSREGHGSPRMVNYETGASNIYASGPRSNIYSLTSVNVADYSEATLKAAIDAAIANNWLISIYWHDDSLSAADKTRLENVIDYAKTTGITFTTLGNILRIT